MQRSELSQAFALCRPALLCAAAFSLVINILMLTGSLYMMQIYDRVLSSQSGRNPRLSDDDRTRLARGHDACRSRARSRDRRCRCLAGAALGATHAGTSDRRYDRWARLSRRSPAGPRDPSRLYGRPGAHHAVRHALGAQPTLPSSISSIPPWGMWRSPVRRSCWVLPFSMICGPGTHSRRGPRRPCGAEDRRVDGAQCRGG